MVEWFVEVCRRRGLKFNAGTSKVMVMNGEGEIGVWGSYQWDSFRAYLGIKMFGMCFGRIRYRWGRMKWDEGGRCH